MSGQIPQRISQLVSAGRERLFSRFGMHSGHSIAPELTTAEHVPDSWSKEESIALSQTTNWNVARAVEITQWQAKQLPNESAALNNYALFLMQQAHYPDISAYLQQTLAETAFIFLTDAIDLDIDSGADEPQSSPRINLRGLKLQFPVLNATDGAHLTDDLT